MSRSIAALGKSLSRLQMAGNNNNLDDALKALRDADSGQLPQWALNLVAQADSALWARLRANPNTYLMTQQESSLFTYTRGRHTSASDREIARKAAARYWEGTGNTNGR